MARSARRTRRLLFSSCFAAGAAALLLALPVEPGSMPTDPDPRNNSHGERLGFGDCYTCHGYPDWRPPLRQPMILTPVFPVKAKVGEAAPFEIRIDNPWLGELRNLSVEITLPGDAPLLEPNGLAAAEPPAQVVRTGELTNPNLTAAGGVSTALVRFHVPADAVRLQGRLELHPLHVAPEADPLAIQVDAVLKNASRSVVKRWSPGDPGALVRTLDVGHQNLDAGPWTLELQFRGGTSTKVSWLFLLDIENGGRAKFVVPADGLKVPKRSHITLPFEMTALGPGVQPVDVHVRAELYYKHRACGTCPDEDYYNRFNTTHVETGDTYVPATLTVALAPPEGRDPRVVVGEVSGIASAVLLPPSLILGGSFGRDSRRAFNWALGGAKRRVMYHNAISLGLTLAAVVHVVLFLWEPQYGLSVGLLWGGLGILCLLGLGLTGYYQVPLIQRHGFDWWRRVHLGLGVFVVVFVAGHSVLDGADFSSLQESLPAWVKSVNWR